jgi:D-alanine-D-alanine ligase
MKVLILTDALKSNLREDEIDTLLQVKAVKKALLSLGHTIEIAQFSINLVLTGRRIERSGCDFVFNLVENLSSSRLLHLAPLLCQTLGIPHSGGSAYTLMVTGDKLLAKKQLSLANLPTPLWIQKDEQTNLSALLHVPLLKKPVAQEASVGITDASVCTYEQEKDVQDALQTQNDIFLEQYIDGREFNISILNGGRILPISEMCFVDYPIGLPKIVGYEAKWEVDSFAYRHTQRTFSFKKEDEPLLEQLKQLSKEVYTLFGASGYARVDFRVDRNNCPYILEMNSNPCIAYDSGFTAVAEQAGLSYTQMIDILIKEGCNGVS